MKKLVLIDDTPWRVEKSLQKLKEAGIVIERILFFSNEEIIPKEYERLNTLLIKTLDVQIDSINVMDFSEKLNQYYEKENVFIMCDFDLDEVNTFEERINVKYANSKPDKGKGKIWFYTTGGKELKSVLFQNFRDQLIDVISFSENQILWDIDKTLSIIN
ncbi:MAG: hypothetical protein HDR71_15520 [Lachnospiraceae bacterium]|nr:hypothetical protein [Lachnospiraceae bacterium]